MDSISGASVAYIFSKGKLVPNCFFFRLFLVSIEYLKAKNCPSRSLWLIGVTMFAFIAFTIGIQHWYRYEYNATVVSLQTDYRSWQYPLFGITVCSNYTDDVAIATIVKTKWNVSKGHTSYAYYDEFVRIIATTTYSTLHKYERYAVDETVQNVDMYDVLMSARKTYLKALKNGVHSPIVTEFGVCYTTGYFRNEMRQNPHFAKEVLQKYYNAPQYIYSDFMKMNVIPHQLDNDTNITIVSGNNYGCECESIVKCLVSVCPQQNRYYQRGHVMQSIPAWWIEPIGEMSSSHSTGSWVFPHVHNCTSTEALLNRKLYFQWPSVGRYHYFLDAVLFQWLNSFISSRYMYCVAAEKCTACIDRRKNKFLVFLNF